MSLKQLFNDWRLDRHVARMQREIERSPRLTQLFNETIDTAREVSTMAAARYKDKRFPFDVVVAGIIGDADNAETARKMMVLSMRAVVRSGQARQTEDVIEYIRNKVTQTKDRMLAAKPQP